MFKNILLAGLGGGIGSMLRFGITLLINSKIFPWATLAINVSGSLMIGIIFALSIRDEAFLNTWKIFLATGICGGFTTFSAFSLENMGMLQSGKPGMALLYIGLSMVLGITATFLGYYLVIKN